MDENKKSSDDFENPLRRWFNIEKSSVLIIWILLFFPAWVRGGTLRSYIWPYFWLAIFAFFIFLLSPYLRRFSHSHGCTLVREQAERIVHDPFFYIGVGFLLQLYVQWWNSGKVPIFVPGMKRVAFSPPYIEWLPGSVDIDRSWDMLVWFLPVFVALMILRHGISGESGIKIIIYWGIIFNAALLAIFGILAPILVKNYPVWLSAILPKQDVFFFSTFGYPNHAGSFFILHLALGCGLFFHYYSSRHSEKLGFIKPWGIMLIIILLLFIAVQLSFCRYAMLFSWCMGVFFLFYLLRVTFLKKSEQQVKDRRRVIVILSLIAIISSVFFINLKERIVKELSTMSRPWKFVEEQFDMKFWQIEAAAKIWYDYPIFGTGGGSFGEYLLLYVDDPAKVHFAVTSRGMRNVHNDFMQFLCEFGLIGTGLMLTVFALLVFRTISTGRWKNPLIFFCLIGVCGVLIHSLIDLPFRSPPVIIAVIIILGVASTTSECEKNKRKEPEIKYRLSRITASKVNFYTILFLFIGVIAWVVLSPIRKTIAINRVNEITKHYTEKLAVPDLDNINPGVSANSSPALLQSLEWAELLYPGYKEFYLLSAKINLDLYRKSIADNNSSGRGYLKKALRSVLYARRFYSPKEIDFNKVYTAVLDAMGYFFAEKEYLKYLHLKYPKDIQVRQFLREVIAHRSHLIRLY